MPAARNPSSLRADADRLIDWYERFKPEGGKRLEINCTRKDFVRAFCNWTQEQIQAAKPVDLPSSTKYRSREVFTLAGK